MCRSSVRMNAVEAGTSITNLVYRALSALVGVAKQDLKTSTLAFLEPYFACYNDGYRPTITTLSGQLTDAANTLSILTMVAADYPKITDVQSSYLDVAGSQMKYLGFVLSSSIKVLSKAASVDSNDKTCPEDFTTGVCKGKIDDIILYLQNYTARTFCLHPSNQCFTTAIANVTGAPVGTQDGYSTEYADWQTTAGVPSEWTTLDNANGSASHPSKIPPGFTSDLVEYLLKIQVGFYLNTN